jgi:hypothetical protein
MNEDPPMPYARGCRWEPFREPVGLSSGQPSGAAPLPQHRGRGIAIGRVQGRAAHDRFEHPHRLKAHDRVGDEALVGPSRRPAARARPYASERNVVVGGTDAPALESCGRPAKSVALLRPACGGGSFRLRLRPLERRPGSATSRWRLMRTPRRIAGR